MLLTWSFYFWKVCYLLKINIKISQVNSSQIFILISDNVFFKVLANLVNVAALVKSNYLWFSVDSFYLLFFSCTWYYYSPKKTLSEASFYICRWIFLICPTNEEFTKFPAMLATLFFVVFKKTSPKITYALVGWVTSTRQKPKLISNFLKEKISTKVSNILKWHFLTKIFCIVAMSFASN